MSTPPLLKPTKAPPHTPSAIWMPGVYLPSCYQGTPLEIVGEMSAEMKPGMGTHDAIDLLLRRLADERNVKIQLPAKLPEGQRSELFITALVMTGVAREMPKA